VKRERGWRGRTSAISEAASNTSTSWPARRSAIAAPKPPRPAPTTMICSMLNEDHSGRSKVANLQFGAMISMDLSFHIYMSHTELKRQKRE
jgi:hypothetical protein